MIGVEHDNYICPFCKEEMCYVDSDVGFNIYVCQNEYCMAYDRQFWYPIVQSYRIEQI
jgi:hypothetical protein